MRLALIAVFLLGSIALVWAGSPEAPPRNLHIGEVYFDFDSTEPLPQRHDEMGRMSNVILQFYRYYGEGMVVIEGHTDSRGENNYNLDLGESRAAAVQAEFLRRKVPRSIIRIVTHGENKPQANNETREGRALNRRAEVYFVK